MIAIAPGIFGRDSEWELVRSAVLDGGILISGAPGAGKTFLAEAVARSFDTWDVYRIRGAASTPAMPFAEVEADLGASAADDPFGGVIARIRSRRRARPQLLVVDDAHLLDDTTARAIAHLVAVIRCRAILTQRAGAHAPEPIVMLWKDSVVERLELHPLSLPDVVALAASLLGAAPSPRLAHWIAESARGIPLYVRESIASGRADGSIVVDDGRAELTRIPPTSTRLVELIESQIRKLPPDQLTLLVALELAQPLTPDILTLLGPPHTLSVCRANGLAERTAAGVVLGHPLFGELALDIAGSAQIARIRSVVAAALEESDPARAAALHLAGGEPPSADLLDRALTRALSIQRVDLAVALASALSEARPTPADVARTGELCAIAGRWERAEEYFARSRALAASEEERAFVACSESRARFEYGRDLPGAQQVARDAATQLTGANAAAVRIFELRTRIFSEPLTALYPELARGASDPSLPFGAQAIALVDAATVAWTLARPLEAIAMADAAASVQGLTDYDAIRLAQVTVGAETWGRGIPAAQAAQARLEEIAAGTGNPAGEVLVPIGRMLIAARRGRAADVIRETVAADWSARKTPNRLYAPISFAEYAFAAASLRDPPIEVDALLADLEAPIADGRAQSEALRHLARARDAYRRGHAPAAEEWIDRAVKVAVRQSSVIYEVLARRERVVLFGADSTDLERLDELARGAQGGLTAIYAAEARAVAADDADALAEIALEAARYRVDHVTWEATTRAHSLTVGVGRFDRTLVHELRLRAIAPVFADQWSAAPETHPLLTDREWEVVALAAAGATNPEIAHRLFLSPHTVKRHLERVATRTGIHGRVAFQDVFATASVVEFTRD